MQLARTLLIVVALTACLSKPRFQGDGDGGPGDGPPVDDSGLLAVGAEHACATAAGKLWCWGSNTHGQLGGRDASTGTPREVAISDASSWQEVVAGDRHTCGLHDGVIDCWGDNAAFQVGGDAAFNRIELPGGAQPRSVHAGATASCAIDTQGQLYCWGTMDDDQLRTPTQVQPGGHASEWSSIAIADDHACALRADGTAWCWGQNDRAQLGLSSVEARRRVDQANQLAQGGQPLLLASISVERDLTCGVTPAPAHALLCVGWVFEGMIYQPGIDNSAMPVIAGGPESTWAGVALGPQHACGIWRADGTEPARVACFGYDTDGALGIAFERSPEPAHVPTASLVAPTKIAVGDHVSCARDATKVMCWGANRSGELGNGEIARTLVPHRALMASGTDVVHEVVAGRGHTCAIVGPAGSDTSGTVYCWGDNRVKQVDWEAAAPFVTQARATGVVMAEEVTAGHQHSCARNDAGTLICWGNNGSQQLGTDASTKTMNVISPPSSATWNKVAAGANTTCAVSSTGGLYCWGAPLPGVSSSGPTIALSSAMDTWQPELAIGEGFGVGAFARGTVDHLGGFGRQCPVGGSPVGGSTPAMPYPYSTHAGSANEVQLAAAQGGGGHGCLRVLANGNVEMYCTGNNLSGQITGAPPGAGDDNSCRNETLLTAPAGTSWAPFVDDEIGIALGPRHTCALVNANISGSQLRPYCWGTNEFGAMGTLPTSVLPAMAADLETVEIATAERHTCVIAAGHKDVYCWGDNRFGEVGNGARFHELPVDVLLP